MITTLATKNNSKKEHWCKLKKFKLRWQFVKKIKSNHIHLKEIHLKNKYYTHRWRKTLGVFFQFCQVGGLAIIHNRNEPNLDRGQRG
jgi:hypothetical protein